MYLVDTNVWLERLLDQTRSEDEDFDRTERRRKTPAEIVKGESSEAD